MRVCVCVCVCVLNRSVVQISESGTAAAKQLTRSDSQTSLGSQMSHQSEYGTDAPSGLSTRGSIIPIGLGGGGTQGGGGPVLKAGSAFGQVHWALYTHTHTHTHTDTHEAFPYA